MVNDFRRQKKRLMSSKCIFWREIVNYFYEPDQAIKESRKGPLFNETLPFYLEKLENIAKANNGHLAVGKLTWADFYFTGLQKYLKIMVGRDITEDRPSLKEVVSNVSSIPAVKAWIETRPKSFV
ncbi:hypothetical protein Trydic_g5839 [Trypoxylus dichotomus]